MAGTTTMSLKLLVDSRGNQVVFGEASNDFVDFLFSLLRLPLSTVISLVKTGLSQDLSYVPETDGIGSIENIYSSIQNMEDAYMASSESKSAILKPKGNNDTIAKSSSASWHTQPLYTCYQNHSYVTYEKSVKCPSCSSSTRLARVGATITMSREMKYVGPISPSSSSKMESYVQGLVTYMVTDELLLSPMSVVSGITLLTRYNLQFGDLEENVVKFQLDNLELDFLECSLKSDSVLTHIFLENKLHLHPHEITNTAGVAGKTVSLRLLVDTKHQRVIFAEAGKDFVDFLCSLLLFPIGTIIRRLTGDTPGRDVVGCVGNIFASVKDLDERYMPRNQSKDNFLMPDQSNYPSNIPLLLPNHDDSAAPSDAGILYTCNHCFPTNYFSDVCATLCPSCRTQMNRTLVFYPETQKDNTPNVGTNVCLATFAVTDDLCITPLSLISEISMLSARFSAQAVNLEARVVEFGMSEGLKILKASLKSKTALTDVYCEARQISIEDDVQSVKNLK